MYALYVIYDVVGCIIRKGDLEFNIHFFSRISFYNSEKHILICDTYTYNVCIIKIVS